MKMIDRGISLFPERKIANTVDFNEYLRNFAKSFDWTTQCLCELDKNTGGPYLAGRRAMYIARAKVVRSPRAIGACHAVRF